ncbi:MAG: hypothetical protein AAGF87_18110 [Bacteroidota bacterium]
MKFLIRLSAICLLLSFAQIAQAQAFVPTPITPAMVNAAQNGGAEMPQPLNITNGQQCIRIRCASQGCEICVLVWRDLNQDGQVQPRRELRCRCQQGDACVLERQEVPCNK